MGYRLLDHTADIAIEAEGEDLGEALSQAARGLAEVVTGRPPPHAADSAMTFTLEAPDEEALVVAFLAELLWLLEQQDRLWVTGGVKVAPGGPGWMLQAHGNALEYDPMRHGIGTEVKAVTYHGLRIERADGVRVRVILDI